MKTARMLALAALLTVAISASANAGGFVWAQSGTDGGPGQALQLACDTTPGVPEPIRCEWTITIMYQTDGYPAGGWMLDLIPDANSIDKLTVKSGQYGPNGGPIDPANNNPFALNNPESIFGGYALVDSAGSSTLVPTAAGTYPLFTFVLSKHKLPGDTNISDIFFRVGFNEWGGDDAGGYEIVGFGPNPPRPGNATGELEPLPFITITNTPEPTTLALLGLGLVGLLRRRR